MKTFWWAGDWHKRWKTTQMFCSQMKVRILEKMTDGLFEIIQSSDDFWSELFFLLFFRLDHGQWFSFFFSFHLRSLRPKPIPFIRSLLSVMTSVTVLWELVIVKAVDSQNLSERSNIHGSVALDDTFLFPLADRARHFPMMSTDLNQGWLFFASGSFAIDGCCGEWVSHFWPLMLLQDRTRLFKKAPVSAPTILQQKFRPLRVLWKSIFINLWLSVDQFQNENLWLNIQLRPFPSFLRRPKPFGRNNNDSQTNLVVEIDVFLGMVVWWGTTHEGVEQHSQCPVAMTSRMGRNKILRIIFKMWIWWAFDMFIIAGMQVVKHQIMNDFCCIVLQEEPMLRHVTSEFCHMLWRVEQVIDESDTFLVRKHTQLFIGEQVLLWIDGTQFGMFHWLQKTTLRLFQRLLLWRERWTVLSLWNKMSHFLIQIVVDGVHVDELLWQKRWAGSLKKFEFGFCDLSYFFAKNPDDIFFSA